MDNPRHLETQATNKINRHSTTKIEEKKKKKGLYRVTVRRTSLMLQTQHRENQIVQHIGKEIGHSQYSNQQQKQVWVLFQKGAVEHMYTILISPPMTSCYRQTSQAIQSYVQVQTPDTLQCCTLHLACIIFQRLS